MNLSYETKPFRLAMDVSRIPLSSMNISNQSRPIRCESTKPFLLSSSPHSSSSPRRCKFFVPSRRSRTATIGTRHRQSCTLVFNQWWKKLRQRCQLESNIKRRLAYILIYSCLFVCVATFVYLLFAPDFGMKATMLRFFDTSLIFIFICSSQLFEFTTTRF